MQHAKGFTLIELMIAIVVVAILTSLALPSYNDYVLRSAPDLIICDINMPHMDGFEFVSALKADSTIPHIPVIFLTTFEEGDDRGKDLGVVGYLTKPIRADRLLALVVRHVPGGRHPIG